MRNEGRKPQRRAARPAADFEYAIRGRQKRSDLRQLFLIGRQIVDGFLGVFRGNAVPEGLRVAFRNCGLHSAPLDLAGGT